MLNCVGAFLRLITKRGINTFNYYKDNVNDNSKS